MGHERVGSLPRSLRWHDIVRRLGRPVLSDDDVADLAHRTLSLVRSRFRHIEKDTGVRSGFTYLVALCTSASATTAARANTIALSVPLPQDRSPFGAVLAGHKFVETRSQSLEYGEITKAALGDAIASWHAQQQTQRGLFDASAVSDVWGPAATGSGFCEVSRLFFARFTERYLNYFLERAASERTRSVADRDRLSRQLHEHVEAVSRHAFETARITQSFAAGWFNRHARTAGLTERKVQQFLSIAFGKLREELRRESGTG